MNVDKILIKADQIYDYLPLISTLSTIVNVIQKLAIKIFNLSCSPVDRDNCYICHISKKSLWRCAATAVPGINLSVALYDFIKFVENDVNYATDVKLNDEDYAIRMKHLKVSDKLREHLKDLTASYQFLTFNNTVEIEISYLKYSIQYLNCILNMKSSIEEFHEISNSMGSEPVKRQAKQCAIEMKETLKICENLLKESEQLLENCQTSANDKQKYKKLERKSEERRDLSYRFL